MSTLELVPAETALVLIDLQSGIVGLPLAPYSGSQIVERSVGLANALRAKGGTIVFVRVLMNEVLRRTVDMPMRDPNAPPAPAAASELVPEIELHPGDLVISKRQWGAFYGTELDQQLRRRAIRTIVIGGIATNAGVESTARAAFDREYELVFVEDAMTSVNAELHQFASGRIFPLMGRVRKTEAVLDALKL